MKHFNIDTDIYTEHIKSNKNTSIVSASKVINTVEEPGKEIIYTDIEFSDDIIVDSLSELMRVFRKESRNKTDKLVTFIKSRENNKLLILTRFNNGTRAIALLNNVEVKKALEEVLGFPEAFKKFTITKTFKTAHHIILNPTLLEMLIKYIINGKTAATKVVKIPKRGKKELRTIRIPNDDYMESLKNINKVFQKKYDYLNSYIQVAYKKNRNIHHNAKVHRNNDYWFKTDIKDFFESCQVSEVDKYVNFLFKNTPNAKNNKKMFIELITHNDALYQGNPVSGTLANAILSDDASILNKIARKTGMKFTVYADDILFSSSKPIAKDYIYKLFNSALEETGKSGMFKLNEKKSFGMTKTNRSITGLTLNDSGLLVPSREIYYFIKVALHKMSHGEDPLDYNVLKGRISFYVQFDESNKMKRLYEKYEDVITRWNLLSSNQISKIMGDDVVEEVK